jgi:large subunit ribosomal protein L15
VGTLEAKLTFEVEAASKGAVAAIEAAGGSITLSAPAAEPAAAADAG